MEFTDIETSSVKPSAKEAYGKGCNVYPPPVADSGDWTDTETRVCYGISQHCIYFLPTLNVDFFRGRSLIT